MFSLLQRFLRNALKHPKIVLGIALAVTLLSIYPVRNLKWELRMIDMLPDSSEVKKTNAIVEENFGGFGSLVAVITSKDSALNSRLVQGLAKELEGNRYINFVEYKSEMDFFEKHKLLYVNTEDLRKIRDRISDLQSRYKFENSPFYIDLLSNDSLQKVVRDSLTREITDSLSLAELEDKYFSKLRNMYSNEKGTVRIVSVFPKARVSDLSASRKLTRKRKSRTLYDGKSLPDRKRGLADFTGSPFYRHRSCCYSCAILLVPFCKAARSLYSFNHSDCACLFMDSCGGMALFWENQPVFNCSRGDFTGNILPPNRALDDAFCG